MTDKQFIIHRAAAICGLSLLGGFLVGAYFFVELGFSMHAVKLMIAGGALAFGVVAIPVMLATLWTRRMVPTFILVIGPCVGAEYVAQAFGAGNSGFFAAYPMLYVTTFLAAYAAAPRPQRVDENRCAECGYDLHGTDSERCAECGHVRGMPATRVDIPVWRRLALWCAGAAISAPAHLFVVRWLLSIG